MHTATGLRRYSWGQFIIGSQDSQNEEEEEKKKSRERKKKAINRKITVGKGIKEKKWGGGTEENKEEDKRIWQTESSRR